MAISSEEWQTKALEYFPELHDIINRNQAFDFCSELYPMLVASYEEQPINEDRIGRIYDYARWCLSQPQTRDLNTDLPNAIAVGLIESLPLNQRVSEDLYRWLSMESFQGFENLFRYHLSDEEYQTFFAAFLRKKVQFTGSPRL